MQDGSVTVERRKRGPGVWCFRWREGGPDGRKIHRRIVLGTADDLKNIASARNNGGDDETRTRDLCRDTLGGFGFSVTYILAGAAKSLKGTVGTVPCG